MTIEKIIGFIAIAGLIYALIAAKLAAKKTEEARKWHSISSIFLYGVLTVLALYIGYICFSLRGVQYKGSFKDGKVEATGEVIDNKGGAHNLSGEKNNNDNDQKNKEPDNSKGSQEKKQDAKKGNEIVEKILEILGGSSSDK